MPSITAPIKSPPSQPPRKSPKYLPHTKPVPALRSHVAPRCRSEPLTVQLGGWFRVTLYEIQELRGDTLRIGILFSQHISALSCRLSKTIRMKWAGSFPLSIKIDFGLREARVAISTQRTLLVVFDAPQSQNPRAVSQHFSRFLRDLAREMPGTEAPLAK